MNYVEEYNVEAGYQTLSVPIPDLEHDVIRITTHNQDNYQYTIGFYDTIDMSWSQTPGQQCIGMNREHIIALMMACARALDLDSKQ